VYETASISNTVTATGDAPITYSLSSGTLPTGSTLDSSTGLLSGTAPASAGSTTYTFTIQASDLQNQTTNRTFSVTVDADAVTWSSPADNTSYTLEQGSAMANVVLSAASAAGKSITYTANNLPTGVSISGSNIAGTPTVTANTTSIITATAAVTNRTATRTLNWVVSVANDPYFNLTTLLLNGDGTNGATNNTFIDSSANALAITRYGNTSQGSFSPYAPAGWSAYFNGNNYTNIYAASSADFNFGSGNFTIECFFNPIDIPSGSFVRLFDTGLITCFFVGGSIYFRNGEANAELVTPVAHGLSNGIWYHLAFVRSGTTYSIYRDGSLLTSGTGGTITSASAPFYIGTNTGWNQPLNGHVNSFRVTNGQALYTTTFTPSTTPLTTTSQNATASNVKLLTCQSNRVVDNSTQNTKTILIGDGGSNVGIRLIQAFSPFAPTVAYSAATHGGSAYFDGTGDYLVGPGNNAALLLGTGDFTFEGWFYQTATNTYPGVLEIGVHVANGILFIASNGSTITAYGPAGFMGTATAPPLNTWNHIAWVRSSGTFKIYVNGVGNAGTASASNFSDNTTLTLGGEGSRANGVYTYSGYMSGVRLVKGTAVYTSNFTPPTAPLTAITNTSLLLNGTNAGITDGTGRNVLETLGDTKISTAVKKYGAGSMVFDGNGDYLSTPITHLNGDFGTGDFTVEFWMNATAAGTYVAVVGTQSISGTTAGMWRVSNRLNSANGIYFNYTTGSAFVDITFSTTNYNDETWHHVAACRASGTLRMFVDGVSVGTPTAVSQNLSSGQKTVVGYNAQDTQYYTGYIDELRITKGVARYTTTFTPPAAAFITR
jgi:hypothetical protein